MTKNVHKAVIKCIICKNTKKLAWKSSLEMREEIQHAICCGDKNFTYVYETKTIEDCYA